MKAYLLLTSSRTSTTGLTSLRNGQHVGLRHIRAFPRVCRYTRVVKLAAADVEQERTVVEDTEAAPVPDAPAGEGSAPRTRGYGDRNRRERPPGARRGPPKEITKPFKDIQEGDVLSGTVCGIQTFGAFIDVGAEVNGLCHISKLTEGFVSNVEDVLQVGQVVEARVIRKDEGVGGAVGKLSLSMLPEGSEGVREGRPPRSGPAGRDGEGARGGAGREGRPPRGDMGSRPPRGKTATRGGATRGAGGARPPREIKSKVGEEMEGTVDTVKVWGAFVKLSNGERGMLHHTNIVNSNGEQADDARDVLNTGDSIKVRVAEIDKQQRINLTMKTSAVVEADKQYSERLQLLREVPTGLRANIMGSALARAGITKSAFVDLSQEPEPAKADKAEAKHTADAAVEAPPAETDAPPAETEAPPAAADPLAAAAPVAAPEPVVEPVVEEPPPPPEPEPVKAAAPAVEEAAAPEAAPEPVVEPAVEEPPPPPAPEPVKAAAPVAEPVAEPVVEPVVEQAPPAPEPEPEPVKASASPAVEEAAPAPAPVEENAPAAAVPEPAEAAAPALEEPAPAVEEQAPEPVKAAAPVVEEPAEEAVPAPPPPQPEPVEAAAAVSTEVTPSDLPQAPLPEPGKAAAPVAVETAAADEPKTAEEAAPPPLPQPEPVEAAAAVSKEATPNDLPPAPTPEPVKAAEPVAEEAAPTGVHMSAQAAVAAPPAQEAAGGISAKLVKELRDKTGGGMMDCKKALVECNGDLEKAAEYLRKKGLVSAEKKAGRVAAEGIVASYIHPGARLGVLVEVNCETDFVARGDKFRSLVSDVAMQIAACPEVLVVDVADVPADLKQKEVDIEMQKEDILSKPEAIRPKIVEGRIAKTLKTWALLEQPFVKDGDKTVAEVVKEAVASIGENIQIRRFARYQLGEGIEKKVADLAKDVEEQTKAFEAAAAAKAAAAEAAPEAAPAAEAAPAVPDIQIPAKVVKELRDRSGAGMMDCKKALAACGGDIEAAADFLRKKGVVSAEKKAGRVAAEGAIGSYIHAGSQLGVLVEVNCETDFVARGDKFKELLQDLAMQIAACPEVSVVAIEDVPASELENERRIEMEKEDIKSKPEAIRGKIVDGRVAKIAKERALLEQPFVKDSNKTVAEVIKEAIAAIGENIKVRRFTRFKLGEGIEKKQTDFAAEVAAQTGGVA